MKYKFFTLLIFLCCNCIFAQEMPNYIAHACGVVEPDYTYSNSKEAFLTSIERGYEFIEVDLDTTRDGILVASHDWESFNINANQAELQDSMLSLEEFKNSVIYGKYTPITIEEIVDTLLKYPNVAIVTDKISDITIIDKYFSEIKDRVYVESFSIEDYTQLRNAGYHAMYSNQIVDLFPVIIENLVDGNTRIDFIVNSTNDDFQEINRIKCLMPFKIAMFSSNSADFINEHLGIDIDLIYTDYYNPSDSSFIK